LSSIHLIRFDEEIDFILGEAYHLSVEGVVDLFCHFKELPPPPLLRPRRL
jgi:hypothetical protein